LNELLIVLFLAVALERAFERVRGAVQFTLRVSGRRRRAPPIDRLTGPGTQWLAERIARLFGLLQQGRIATYLMYSFLTLVATLLAVKR
jgi:hypothetical protein